MTTGTVDENENLRLSLSDALLLIRSLREQAEANEASLRQSNERLRAMLREARDWTWRTSLEGQFGWDVDPKSLVGRIDEALK